MKENRDNRFTGLLGMLALALLLLASAAWADVAPSASSCSGLEWRTIHIGERARLGGWILELSDISVAVGPTNVHPAIFTIYNESGIQMDMISVMSNSTLNYTRKSDGKMVAIKVGHTAGTTLSSKWAEVVVEPDCAAIDDKTAPAPACPSFGPLGPDETAYTQVFLGQSKYLNGYLFSLRDVTREVKALSGEPRNTVVYSLQDGMGRAVDGFDEPVVYVYGTSNTTGTRRWACVKILKTGEDNRNVYSDASIQFERAEDGAKSDKLSYSDTQFSADTRIGDWTIRWDGDNLTIVSYQSQPVNKIFYNTTRNNVHGYYNASITAAAYTHSVAQNGMNASITITPWYEACFGMRQWDNYGLEEKPMQTAQGSTEVQADQSGTTAQADKLTAADENASCVTTPRLEILTPRIESSVGRVRYVDVRVSATHPSSCGAREYGVDFTDAYAARYFILGMERSNVRFLFNLSAGESRTFRGVVGIPLNTPVGEHRLQMTAYSPSDIWKQVSGSVMVQVHQFAGSDLLWRTNLTLGWNIIPSMEGAAFLGCDDIQKAYRYSQNRGDYIEMERYGAQFVPKAGEPDLPEERMGGLAIFARKRCSMSTVADSSRLDGQRINLTSNQERSLTVPYPWYGKTKARLLATYCPTADADAIAFTYWNASSQRWIAAGEQALFAGQVLYIKTGQIGGACALPLEG